MTESLDLENGLELWQKVKGRISFEEFQAIMSIGRIDQQFFRESVVRYRFCVEENSFSFKADPRGGWIMYDDFRKYVDSLDVSVDGKAVGGS
jgi:hypothetical protein